MNDLHEQSRLAFEAEAESELNSTMRDSHGQYLAALTSVMWQAWCRALDYAAEQQTKQPEPLTRPDRAGWWWCWSEHGTPPRWLPVVVHPGWKCNDGIWVEATPPPDPLTAPTTLADRENAL